MQEPVLSTIGDALYWSYANMIMAERAVYDKSTSFQQLHFIIRNRMWSGLRNGKMKIGSLVKDARVKMRLKELCTYCGAGGRLTVDHLIPSIQGGRESGDNI